MRTYVRVRAGRRSARRRSCTPTSTPSTRRSSSATTLACAGGRSSSAAAWCCRRATRPGRAACAPRWADARPASCARGRSWSRPGCRPTPRRAAAVFEVFDDTTPLVEGLSIDEAFLDVGGLRRISGTPTEIAVRLRERRARRRSVCRSRSAWPAPSSSPRSRAAWRSPTACSSCRPTASSTSSTRCRVERLWGVGPATAREAARRAGSPPWATSPRLTEASLVSMLGAASGRHLHALAHNRDPRPVVVGRRRRSIGSQHALGRRRRVG